MALFDLPEIQNDYYDDYGNFVYTNVDYYQNGSIQEIAFPEVGLGAKAVIGIVYTLSMLVCGIGNILLCYVIYRFRRMRTITNLLIGNLALSDFLVAVICSPFNFYYYINQTWPFGKAVCVIVSLVKVTSLYVSTNSLLAIAIDRYYIIMNPLRPRMAIRKALVIILAVWVVAITVALPSAIHSDTWLSYGSSVQCSEILWKNPKALQINTIFLLSAEFIAPLIIISLTYAMIARKLWFRKIPGSEGQLTPTQEVALEQSKKKSIRMLIIVVVLFALCWIPYYTYSVLRDFFWVEKFITSDNIKKHFTFFYIVEAIAMSNSMFNTLIYILFNANYRKYVYQIPLICRKGNTRNSPRYWSQASNRFRSPLSKATRQTSLQPVHTHVSRQPCIYVGGRSSDIKNKQLTRTTVIVHIFCRFFENPVKPMGP
ncbi:prokineticin receptor 2-like [Glandiceps talaboti]